MNHAIKEFKRTSDDYLHVWLVMSYFGNRARFFTMEESEIWKLEQFISLVLEYEPVVNIWKLLFNQRAETSESNIKYLEDLDENNQYESVSKFIVWVILQDLHRMFASKIAKECNPEAPPTVLYLILFGRALPKVVPNNIKPLVCEKPTPAAPGVLPAPNTQRTPETPNISDTSKQDEARAMPRVNCKFAPNFDVLRDFPKYLQLL